MCFTYAERIKTTKIFFPFHFTILHSETWYEQMYGFTLLLVYG